MKTLLVSLSAFGLGVSMAAAQTNWWLGLFGFLAMEDCPVETR